MDEPENNPVPEHIVLTLDFDPATQQIMVNGPIQNRMLCYGLLKMAEKAIDECHLQQQRKGIQRPDGMNPDFLRRMGRR